MIKQTLVIALTCAGIALGSAVQAGGRDGNPGRHGPGHAAKYERGNYDRSHWRGDRDYRQGYRDGWRDAPRVVVNRGWGPPPHRWVRGDRLPNFHRGGYYVVHDWHAHRLYRPRPGYQWVRVGPEYLLVAVASGVIASIILNQ